MGNRRLLAENGLAIDADAEAWLRALDDEGETALLVAEGGSLAGVIGLRDVVRPKRTT